MAQDTDIAAYLAEGGKLTSPANVPARYRAELMKLMATFVDSELAGAAGFADVINAGPGIKERIAAARIVLEKTDHADRVLRLMGEFGADTARCASHHPWTARLPRDAEVGAVRSDHDMRLAVFNYPLDGWADAVVMNVLMGLAVAEQMADFVAVSYQPLAEAFRTIAPVELRHADLGIEGLERLAGEGAALQAHVDYWWPRVAGSFGRTDDARLDWLRSVGLRGRGPAEQRAAWEARAGEVLKAAGLRAG